MINTYLIVSIVIFFLMGLMWKKDIFIDFIIKLIFLIMSIIGLILVLVNLGYLVKI
jgi:hypothetical protein